MGVRGGEGRGEMVRGAAKEKSQAERAKKDAARQKAGSQKEGMAKNIKMTCPVCKSGQPGYKVFVQHWDAKHAKVGPCPAEDAMG